MEACEQTQGQTIMAHGQSVWAHTKRLILGDFAGFRLPEWFLENHHFIVNNLHDWKTIERYNIFHDCGKPFCRVEDADGKVHFPNHAEVSASTFREVFPDEKEVAELISLDMVLHTETFEQISARNIDLKTRMTLLVTAFAEIHSNAKLFGGIESTSFKIKWKKLNKLGKKLIADLPTHDDSYAYVFVRNDLPDVQKVVQAAHSIFEAARHAKAHPSIVALGVKSETKLKKVMEYLMENEIQFKIFREPMPPFNNEITAVVTEPLVGERRSVLRKFQLLQM